MLLFQESLCIKDANKHYFASKYRNCIQHYCVRADGCVYLCFGVASNCFTLALPQLYGAATMNNTLGLGIFAALVYFRDLDWQYSAGT